MFEKRKRAKYIEVQIARSGNDAEDVRVKEDSTVEDALDQAGMRKKDTESIRINQKEASLTTKLKDGDRVVLAKKIQGGVN